MKTLLSCRSNCFRVLLALCLCLSAPARGEIKNFTFRGTISDVDDMVFVLDGSITNGAAFEGFYIFESTAADSLPDPTVGNYVFTESAFGIVLKVGNYVFRTNPRLVEFQIQVVNRPERDNYQLLSYHNVCSQPLAVEHIAWQLDDASGAALTNESLPLTPPTLSEWQSEIGLTVSGGCDPGYYFIRGTINFVSEAPAIIPERPATTINEAIEVRWPSRLGYFYQIQSSRNMETWSNVGEPVLGDGTELSRFFPRRSGEQVFYRAEIANFSR